MAYKQDTIEPELKVKEYNPSVKSTNPEPKQEDNNLESIEYPEEDINSEDIPF